MFNIKKEMRELKELQGVKINHFKAATEDLCFYLKEITRIPRRSKYWFKSNFTKTTIKVATLHGGWHDADYKLLHTNFQILVDFVEKELSSMYDSCNLSEYGNTKLLEPKPRTPREKGEAYLLHVDEPDYENQSEADIARDKKYKENHKKQDLEVLKLYRWWKDTRPNRIDPWEDLAEWRKLNDFKLVRFETSEEHPKYKKVVFAENDPLYKDYRRTSEQASKIDDGYDKEDTKMLKKLIDIRHQLWT